MSEGEYGQEVPDLPSPPESPTKSSPAEETMVDILRNANENHFELNNHSNIHIEDGNTIESELLNGKNYSEDHRPSTENLVGNSMLEQQMQNMRLDAQDSTRLDLEKQYLEELLDEHVQNTLSGIDDTSEETAEAEIIRLEEDEVLQCKIRNRLQDYARESFDKTLADSVPEIVDYTLKDDTVQEAMDTTDERDDPSQDRLVEVAVEDWPRLRDMFTDFWPRDILAYNALDNHLSIKSRYPSAASRVLCLNGDWSDGTFILQDSIAICVYTLEESCCRLERALRLFDWSIGPQIHPYDEKHKSVVDKVRQDLGLDIVYNYETIFYWLPREHASQFDLTAPDDVHVAALSPEHAEIANPVWSRKFDGSDLYMRDAIRNNPSRGVFGKEEGDLRSWIMSHNNGVLLALHTHPDHRRKGYGSLILKAISRAKADENSDTVASVLPSNIASVTLFNKLGFKPLEPKWWTKTKPF